MAVYMSGAVGMQRREGCTAQLRVGKIGVVHSRDPLWTCPICLIYSLAARRGDARRCTATRDGAALSVRGIVQPL